jgi:hypothetical protein
VKCSRVEGGLFGILVIQVSDPGSREVELHDIATPEIVKREKPKSVAR